MRVRVLLALMVAAAVAGLWWMGRDDPAQERRRDLVEVPDPPIEVRAPDEPEPAEPEAQPDEANPESLPEDPVESGDCDLLLKVVDADTNKPVRTEVTLWRLDAPATEHWTQGDQIQALELAGHGIVRFEDLPAGNYRAVCSRRRLAGEDSRVLYVQGELTEETIAIHLPRKFKVYLKVFDLEGHQVTKGTILKRGESRMSTKRLPKWRRPRRLIDAGAGQFSAMGMGGGTAFVGRGGTASTATEKGFFLGELEENPYAWRLSYRYVLKVPGCSDVLAVIDGDLEAGTTYVGLTVPDEPIRERILLPDGKRADKSGAYLSISMRAVKDDGTAPMARVKQVPVKIAARLKGYERLDLEFPPDTPFETRYLAPAAASDRQG